MSVEDVSAVYVYDDYDQDGDERGGEIVWMRPCSVCRGVYVVDCDAMRCDKIAMDDLAGGEGPGEEQQGPGACVRVCVMIQYSKTLCNRSYIHMLTLRACPALRVDGQGRMGGGVRGGGGMFPSLTDSRSACGAGRMRLQGLSVSCDWEVTPTATATAASIRAGLCVVGT